MNRKEQDLFEELTLEIRKLRDEMNVLKHLLHNTAKGVAYSAVEIKTALEQRS